MVKYNTKKIDYTGCDPVIAEHLQRGEVIECYVWDGIKTVGDRIIRYVVLYSFDAWYPYRTVDGVIYQHAEPIQLKQTYVKKASDIVRWLEDNGYIVDVRGNWSPEGGNFARLSFDAQMFQYCGKFAHVTPEAPAGTYYGRRFLDEWLEER